jgi:hypothetical protein
MILKITFLALFSLPLFAQDDFDAQLALSQQVSIPAPSGPVRLIPNVGWWKMQDGAGSPSTTSDSVGGFTGTLIDTATWETKAPAGGTYSIEMFNNGDSVSIGSSSSLLPTDFTIRAWIYPTSFTSDEDIWSSTTTGGIEVRLDTTGDIELLERSTASLAISSSAVTLNAWNYVALTFNGATLTFYINGVSAGSDSISPSFTAGSMYIGFSFLNNYITNVGLWNEALTSTQITEDYGVFP